MKQPFLLKILGLAVTSSALSVAISPSANAATAPDLTVVEFFHKSSGHFFITGSPEDQSALDAAGSSAFVRTGRAFSAWSKSAVARPAEAVEVMRFFSPSSSSHVFTSNPKDISALRALPATATGSGFVDEGPAFFAIQPSADSSCATGLKAIYRAYNNRADGNHRYVNDVKLQAAMVASGFIDDAVAFCSHGTSANDVAERAAGTTPPTTEDVTVTGLVSAFVSVSNFMIGTQKVDASNARFENGAAAALANGVSVAVEGVVVSGVLVATEVHLPPSAAAIVDEFKGFVTSLGSAGILFVNGTRVDASAAVVTGGTLAALRVGNEVEMHGVFVAGTFVASRFKIEDAAPVTTTPTPPVIADSEVKGVVARFVSLSDFTVAGQKVNAKDAVFKDGTAAALANGATVEVRGPIVSGVLIATRVEIKAATPITTPPLSNVVTFEATGAISAFVSVSSFTVGGQTIDASTATFKDGSAASLANGVTVEVKGTLAAGVVKATRVEIKSTVTTTPPVAATFEATAAITNFVSVSSFKVNGQAIDASAATFKNGTAASLANGVTVEVKGTLTAGVVKATSVEIKSTATTPPPAAVAFEATGAITDFVSVSSFKVGGQTIDASAATFKDGTAASLANGVIIEVEGTLTAGVVKATKVEIKSPVTTPPAAVAFEATGVVTDFVSVSSFKVGGQAIDASAATFKDGTAASLVNGVTVEVKGTLTAGVVKATSVEIKSTVTPPPAATPFEATAAITNFVSVSNFKVNGQTIDASAATFKM